MADIEAPLFRAGADGVILEDFRSLRSSGRYSERHVIIPLAQFLVGLGGGPNKDSPLYELCYLIFGVGQLLGNDREKTAIFFLGIDWVSLENLRSFLAANAKNNKKGLCTSLSDSIQIQKDGGSFHVKFGRMPFLVAVYEFLMGMEGFGFYEEFQEIAEGLRNQGSSETENRIRGATNKLSSRLRLYRRAHLVWAAKQDKFDPIYQFLRDRSDRDHIIIDDKKILEFWCIHSRGKDFRGYKTVFDSFINFHRVLQLAERTQATEEASTIGLNKDAGEIEVADQDYDLAFFGDWTSPLTVFDEEDVCKIKFLKKSSEYKPIELLMYYGPHALYYPLAFLRLGSFGAVQTGITNDLQLKRPKASLERRISCQDAEPYPNRVAILSAVFNHIQVLQKAVFHFIHSLKLASNGNIIQFPVFNSNRELDAQIDEVAVQSEAAFRSLKRKGFEEPIEEDDSRSQAFHQVVDPLGLMEDILKRILGKIEGLGEAHLSLDQLFLDDQKLFREQFCNIYNGGNHEQV